MAVEYQLIPSGSPGIVKHVIRPSLARLWFGPGRSPDEGTGIQLCTTVRPPGVEQFPCQCGRVIWCRSLLEP